MSTPDDAPPTPNGNLLPAPLRLGELELTPPLLLAPMAGYTNAPFRTICHTFGAALSFTEMTNAAGLAYGSKPSWHLLETFDGEGPVAAHLYGCEPTLMAEAARRVAKTGRFVAIDINCGCPVRKIVKKGCGAALMETPELIGRIVKAVADAVDIPVMVKTRIGLRPGEMRAEQIGRISADNGAVAMTIHGRHGSRGHQGPVDWAAMAELAEALPIPVIGNGGLYTAEQAVEAMHHSPIAAIMLARGTVGYPWLFREIRGLLDGTPTKPPSLEERRSLVAEHLAGLVELKKRELLIRRHATLSADDAAALAFLPHWHQYLKGLHHWGDIRASINHNRTIPEILATTDRILARQ